MLKMRKTKKIYKKSRGGKLPKQNDSENNSDNDNVPSMRDLMNRYNRLLNSETPPTSPPPTNFRNELVYPETPPRENQMPDYDSDEEIIERRRTVPGAPRRNRHRPEEIDEIEEDELFERPILRRQNGLNEREFAVAFPHMSDSDTEEEIFVDNDDNDENQLPRQGGSKRKTTRKRKTAKKRKTTRKRKTTKKRKTSRKH